mmetsp:Transcript_63718/g.170726  ORF Transcript_63718/g.170726 Transcript_63718/m.170726 type:complete len:135 (-) Transcript_63718:282-686(-)
MHNEAQRPEITTIVRAIAKETVTAVRGIIAFNKKHRITSKTRAAASNAVGKVRIHPLARVFQSFNRPPLSSQAVAFEREHRVREKMSTAARGAYDQVACILALATVRFGHPHTHTYIHNTLRRIRRRCCKVAMR